MLNMCPVHLRAGEYTPDAAGSLMAVWRKQGIADAEAKGGFNADPLGTLAAHRWTLSFGSQVAR